MTEPRTSESHNGLECLAPELVLMIATQLPDLISLDSLLRASPNTFRIFNNGNAVKIIESVLSAGFTHPHIRVIICVMALIRSSTLPISTLDGFRKQVTLEAMENRTFTPGSSFSPTHLFQNTTPAVLRSILAATRRITCLTLNCLEHYLARFRSLRPQHLVDREFHWHGIQPWEVKPPRRSYQTQEVGPPSCVEEQRVFRAFWRIQMICDLKKAASYSMLSWPADDIERLNSAEPIELFYQEALYIRLYREEPHPEFEEIRSVMHYMREVQREDSMRQLDRTSRFLEVQRGMPCPVPVESDWVELEIPSQGVRHYDSYVDPGMNFFGYGFSPLRNISFGPFRSLGFAFWDLQRLAAYGLLPPLEEAWDHFQTTFYLFAWQSVLTADELAEQDRQNMAQFGGIRWQMSAAAEAGTEEEIL